ncbi:MAG: DUF4160 domain-containing protein [Flavobacteriales bacterium]|nr:DUF4160 domain-containing protein [Flavobacteriales bacterium]
MRSRTLRASGSSSARSNDEPPHIHVERGEGSAKWWLTPEPRLVYSLGFKVGEQRKIERLVNIHQPELLQAWTHYFGH